MKPKMNNGRRNEQWWEINVKWWQINLALWLLLGLFFLYFRLPTYNDLMKNIIVGGLILSLILFLGVAVPKIVMRSFTAALSQTRNSLITDITLKFEEVVKGAREEREKEHKELIQTIAGGQIVLGLTSNMKKEGHEDLELYRFLGLKGEQEDRATFNTTIFQDFYMQEGNDNAVYFFWVNTATTPPSQINAKVVRENNSLIVSFETHTIGGGNIAIRPTRDIARRRDNTMRYLCFDMRLIKEDESDSNNVEIGFRVVNGWLQHWEYSTKKGEGYKKVLLKNFGIESSDGESHKFQTFNLDLEKTRLWHLFESDGNYLYGPKPADFSVITSVIFEVGCAEQGQQKTLAPKPGPGKGKFEVKYIRLSEREEGHSISTI